jgi:hypothetical protein
MHAVRVGEGWVRRTASGGKELARAHSRTLSMFSMRAWICNRLRSYAVCPFTFFSSGFACPPVMM